MTSTVDTSTVGTAVDGANQRKVARTSTGRLWVLFDAGGTWELHYSDDAGVTWAHNASADLAVSGTTDASFFVDVDDHAHIAYSTGTGLFYRRMASIGPATAWGSAVTVHFSSNTRRADVVAHRLGSGWAAHIVYGQVTSTTNTVRHAIATTTADGVTTIPTSTVIGGDYGAGNIYPNPSIDFHHTGDGKTISGLAPHLYAAWRTGSTGTGHGIRFRKATWAGGSWTWGTERAMDTTSHALNGLISSVFDGARCVIAYVDSTASDTIKVRERDAADTATTTRTPNSLSDGTVTAVSVSYDPNGDVHLYAVGATSQDPKRTEYVRGTGTWGTWDVVEATTATSLSIRRGYVGGGIDAVYTTGTASPYDIRFDRLEINQPPDAPSWDMLNAQPHDLNAGLPLDWTHNDPDVDDPQGAYALSRVVDGGTVAYWNAGTSAWEGTEVQNLSATTAATIPSGWGASGETHKYAVKTWDEALSQGSYSSELTVYPSVKSEPSITSPADAAVLATSSVALEWTVAVQTAYRARLLSSAGSVRETSGWVTSTATLHPFEFTLSNLTTYKVELTTKNADGLESSTMTHTVTTDFTVPADPTVTIEADNPAGAISLQATHPTPTGTEPTVTSMDVYRRRTSDTGDGIRKRADMLPTGTFTDYEIRSGIDYAYRLRVNGDNGVSVFTAWTETSLELGVTIDGGDAVSTFEDTTDGGGS